MRSIIVLPGQAPHWVTDHARYLAQRLAHHGRTVVAFTHRSAQEPVLPGQGGQSTLLGSAPNGFPLWTGRLRRALGIRRRRDVVILFLWEGSNLPLALVCTITAKIRGERVVLHEQGQDPTGSTAKRVTVRLIERLADRTVRGWSGYGDGTGSREVLALCGKDFRFADLAVQAFEAMAKEAAGDWHLVLQCDEDSSFRLRTGRRNATVTVACDTPTEELVLKADVVVVSHGSQLETFAALAVLDGATGIMVGHPVAGRVARGSDGVWLSRRDESALLVALESATGAASHPPVSVPTLRAFGDRVVSEAIGCGWAVA